MSHSEGWHVSHSEVVDAADPRPATGDEAVDDVLGRLDGVTHESLDVQIEVSEQVHRVLQDRLADLADLAQE